MDPEGGAESFHLTILQEEIECRVSPRCDLHNRERSHPTVRLPHGYTDKSKMFDNPMHLTTNQCKIFQRLILVGLKSLFSMAIAPEILFSMPGSRNIYVDKLNLH